MDMFYYISSSAFGIRSSCLSPFAGGDVLVYAESRPRDAGGHLASPCSLLVECYETEDHM